VIGKAISQPKIANLPISWSGPDCKLQVTLDGDRFRAVGSYERSSLGLGSLFAGTLGHNAPPTRYVVDYSGVVKGRAIQGSVMRNVEGKMPSLLGSASAEKDFIMVLSDAGSELSVMEPAPKKGQFYSLKAGN
jgi:hypothetical protein